MTTNNLPSLSDFEKLLEPAEFENNQNQTVNQSEKASDLSEFESLLQPAEFEQSIETKEEPESSWGRRAAIGAESIVSGGLGAVGDLFSLVHGATKWAGNKVTEFVLGGEEEAKKHREALAKRKAEIEPDMSSNYLPESGIPTTETFHSLANYLTDDYFEPQTESERLIQTSGEFVGSGLTTAGLGSLARGGNAIKGALSASNIAGDIGAGLGFGLARESEAGPIGEIGSSIVGGVLGRKAYGGARKAGVAVTSPKQAIAETFAPKTLAEDVISAGERAGVDLPISASTDSKTASFVENQLSNSNWSGEYYNKASKKFSDEMLNKYEDILTKISPEDVGATNLTESIAAEAQKVISSTQETSSKAFNNFKSHITDQTPLNLYETSTKLEEYSSKLGDSKSFSADKKAAADFINQAKDNLFEASARDNPIRAVAEEISGSTFDTSYQAGRTIKTTMQDSLDALRNRSNQFYEQSKQNLTTNEVASLDKVREALEDIISKSKNLVGGGSKTQREVTKYAQDYWDSIKDMDSMSIIDMIANQQSVNDSIKWDLLSDKRNILKKISEAYSDTITEYGKINPEFGQAYSNAKSTFKEWITSFEKPAISKMMSTETPEIIESLIKKPSNIEHITASLAHIPEGSTVANKLKRFAIENVVGKDFISSKNPREMIKSFKKGTDDKLRSVIEGLPEAEGHRIMQAIEEVKEMKTSPMSAYKASDPRKAVDILADLEVMGTVSKKAMDLNPELRRAFEEIKGAISNDIKRSLKGNSNAYNSFESTIKNINDSSKLIKNDMLTSLAAGKKPDLVLRYMDDPKGIREVGKILGQSSQGKRLFEIAKKTKLQELIGSKIVDPISGRLLGDKMASLLSDKKTKRILIELVGEDNYKSLQDLGKISQTVSEKARALASPTPRSAGALDLGLAWNVVASIAKSVGTANPSPMIKAGLGWAAPKIMAKFMTDPNFKRLMIEASRAAKANNQRTFYSRYQQLLKAIQKELAGAQEEEPVQ